jgi:hypothetical protein
LRLPTSGPVVTSGAAMFLSWMFMVLASSEITVVAKHRGEDRPAHAAASPDR